MIYEEVDRLCSSLHGEIVETHISWVILTLDKAYKIKKPVHFSFLDFSTLEARKAMCHEELKLNRRLTDIYLKVQPIVKLNGEMSIGFSDGEVVDYTVVMRRMPDASRMDIKISENRIHAAEVKLLAIKLADFHSKCEIVKTPDNAAFVEKRFKDVMLASKWVKENLGESYYKVLLQSIEFHDAFIKEYWDFLQSRVKEGNKRDVHGDLHTQNIFLHNDIQIFDCIEFDKKYREIDLLSEIAFLFMDLDAMGRGDLSKLFLEAYQNEIPCINNEIDNLLFYYYLCYRANVKVKVYGLRVMNEDDKLVIQNKRREIKNYLDVLKKYLDIVNGLF